MSRTVAGQIAHAAKWLEWIAWAMMRFAFWLLWVTLVFGFALAMLFPEQAGTTWGVAAVLSILAAIGHVVQWAERFPPPSAHAAERATTVPAVPPSSPMQCRPPGRGEQLHGVALTLAQIEWAAWAMFRFGAWFLWLLLFWGVVLTWLFPDYVNLVWGGAAVFSLLAAIGHVAEWSKRVQMPR